MTKQQNNFELNKTFENSMVDIPDPLKQQLVKIPHTQNVWDWAVILQVIFLIPFISWGLIKLFPFVIKFVKMTSELPISSYGEATIAELPINNFAIIMIVSLVVAMYFALKEEIIWR